jgi:hypothetical protein
MSRNSQTTELSRRTFLTTTGAAMAGVALSGGLPQPVAAPRHPKQRRCIAIWAVR